MIGHHVTSRRKQPESALQARPCPHLIVIPPDHYHIVANHCGYDKYLSYSYRHVIGPINSALCMCPKAVHTARHQIRACALTIGFFRAQ